MLNILIMGICVKKYVKQNDLISTLIKLLEKRSQVMLIKGDPGSGKTTFCLSLLRKLENCSNCFYFAVREDINKIIDLRPSLIENIPRENIVQLKLPKHISITKIKERIKYLEFEGKHPLFKKIYDLTADLDRSFVIIDSIDALEEELEDKTTLTSLLKDIIELGSMNNISFIIVREKPVKEYIDYIADVVIYLKKKFLHNRLIRYLIVDKIKFFPILQSFYSFSLVDDKFLIVSQYKDVLQDIQKPKQFPIKHHSENNFFTSIPLFDEMLSKGFPKGSTVVVGFDLRVPIHHRAYPFLVTAINFQLQEKFVMIIPPIGFPEEILTKALDLYVPKEKQSYVFFRFSHDLTLSEFILWDQQHKDKEEYMKIITLSALQTYLTDKESISYVTKNILDTKERHGLLFLIGDIPTTAYHYFKRVASFWFEIYNFKYNQILISRVPKDPIAYLLRPHVDHGYPELDAIPIH